MHFNTFYDTYVQIYACISILSNGINSSQLTHGANNVLFSLILVGTVELF